MEAILQAIAAADHQELRGRTVAFYEYDPTADFFVSAFRISQGVVVKQLSSTVRQNGTTARVLRSGRPLVVKDTTQQEGLSDKRPGWFRSFVAVPVEAQGIPCGVLYLNSVEPDAFTDEDIAFLQNLARQIGAFGETMRLNRPSEFSIVRVLAATVDAKDTYTQNHSINVAFFARRIARQMGLSPNERKQIDLAALLHDIGKIGIPDQVLRKPGRLTPEEWTLVRAHPVIGANILRNASELADLVPLVRHHHERYDGGGYPDGLSGDAIPLGAAIIGLADAFEAMTSKRVYQDGRMLDQVLAEIRRCRGTQFNPDVVDAFEAAICRAAAANELWTRKLGQMQGELLSPVRVDSDETVTTDQTVAPGVRPKPSPLEFLEQARSIQQLTGLDELLEAVSIFATTYTDAPAAQIFLQDEESGDLKLAKNQGTVQANCLVDMFQEAQVIKPGEGLIGWATFGNQVVNISDARLDPRWPHRERLNQGLSVLIIPLPGTGRVLGALQLLAFGTAQWSADQARVLQVFSTIAGQAIDRIQSVRRSVQPFA